MIDFYLPTSQGEWGAFGAASLTILIGAARLCMVLLSLRGAPSAVGLAHLAGFQIGTGLTAILMAQPLLYLALGGSWAVAAVAQILAMSRHGRGGAAGLVEWILSVLLASLPLAYVFGYFQ